MKSTEMIGWESIEKQFPNDKDHYRAIAHIRHNESKKIVDYETSVRVEDGKPIPFWWTPDGNAGCDCNRALFFYGDDHDHPCGNKKFSVNLSNPVDGKVFYREFE